LLHADGQIDMSKLTVAFRNFTNSPKSLNQEQPRLNGKNKTVTIIPKVGMQPQESEPTNKNYH